MLATVDTAQAGFDPLKKRVINELGRGHNGKLQLQFKSRTWAGTGAWPGIANGSTFSDNGYQCSWERDARAVRRDRHPQPLLGGSVTDAMTATSAFSTHTNAQKVKNDAEAGLAQISAVYPSVDWNGKVTQSIWHKNPFAKHGYAYYRVGQYTTFGGHEGVRQGGVLFAGDHCSQDFQGFMEVAASEGERAGKELLARL